jgi:hypothetical protein
MKNRIIFFLVALFAIACGKGDDEGTSETRDFCDPSTGNYMNVFITKPDKVELEFDKYGASSTTEIKMWIPSLKGCSVSYAFDEDLPMYKRYAEFYGDTTYRSMHIIGEAVACAAPVSNITVVCDKDFDETHSMGTVLNDLFQISYPRYYQYIKSGYKPATRMNSFQLDSICELAVFKDISLFAEYSTLIFKSTPTTPGKYTFTVTLAFGEDPLTGEKVTVPPASIEIEF